MSREVHPVADLFPMLAEDELRELADDINARGLLYPIVLDVDGRILDGRNRLAACELAGVKPTFVTYDGDDPAGYALAVNVARRHLSKGQIAMVTAMGGRLTVTTKSVYSVNTRDMAAEAEVSAGYIAKANVVLDHAMELVPGVVAGKSLNDAYVVAVKNRDRKRRLAALDRDLSTLVEAEVIDLAEAERRAADNERTAKLPPDLIERVSGGLSLDEAEAIVRERGERVAAMAAKTRTGLEHFVRMAGYPVPVELKEHLTPEELISLCAILGALETLGDAE